MQKISNDTGWVCLHRKLLDNPICEKADYLAVWVHLLLMANHKETTFIWNNKKQVLKAGQLLTGRKKLSKKTGVAESQVYKILKYLELEQQIEQQKTTKYTVITIVNWDRYQDKEQQKEQQSNNRVTTEEQQSNTYNNVNNDNNVDNNIPLGIGEAPKKERTPKKPEHGNQDLISLKKFLVAVYPKPLDGIGDTRKLWNLYQVVHRRKGLDEWMEEDWRKNIELFVRSYVEDTEEKFLVASIDKLREKAKLWREYRGKLN